MAGECGFELFSVESPFSLRHEAPFDIEGKTFYSVLQCLMYRKAEFFKDKEQAFNIMQTRDLKVIERCGQNVQMVDSHTWNKERIIWLEFALEKKFSQNQDLKKSLFDTFPRILVYATNKDRFWSIGLSDKNPDALFRKNWKGNNLFGEVLTKIRDKLMKMENWPLDHGEGQDKGVIEQAELDERREGSGGNSQGIGGQSRPDKKRQCGRGNNHGVEGHAAGDERRQDGGGNSRRVEGHMSVDERRQGGGRNSHGEDAQVCREWRRQGGSENSHGVRGRHTRRQAGGRNSYGVKDQDEGREGKLRNSHGTDGQEAWDESNQGRGRNNYEGAGRCEGRQGKGRNSEVKANRNEKWQGGGGNSHRIEGQADWNSKRQMGKLEDQKTEGEVSRDHKMQDKEAKKQVIDEHTLEGNTRQGGKGQSSGIEGQAAQGGNRHGGKRKHQGPEGHEAQRKDKESDRMLDWQAVADEMPLWDESESTSRPKRRITNEQTRHDWSRHGKRDMGSRYKGSYTDMPNQDKFVLFFGNQSPFSQNHAAKFVIDGTLFNCAEQYMMYQKTVIFGNKEMEEKIMGTSSHVEQKRYSLQIPEFKFEVWKKHFIDVVERATEAKFSQNPHLQEPLFATYPKLLVEASPSDRLWGIGRSQKDPLAWDKETWRGKNQLGYIITRVRDRLMGKEDTHWEEWEKWKDDRRWEEMEEEEKRRWEQSNFNSGNTKERTPKTKRAHDGVRDDEVTQKDNRTVYQSRRESYKRVSGKENFEFFAGIHSPFSQHHPTSFTVSGQTFASAEQYSLYQMAVMVGDRKLQEDIMSTTDRNKLKRYSGRVQNVYWEAWELKGIQFVESSIIEKFSQNSDLKEKLFATYPKLLAFSEDYQERFWGIGFGLGFTKIRPDAWDTDYWNGENVLGYILTAVRDELMEKEKKRKELDVEDVRLHGTIEGEGKLDGKTILLEEDRTVNETVMAGDDGKIRQVVTPSQDEKRVESMKMRRTDEDVEAESGQLGEQNVRENLDDEMEEVTSSKNEFSENKDAHTALRGNKSAMEQHQRARNSVGEEEKFEPVKENGGTGEEDVGLCSTDVGEGNGVEQQKVEKNHGQELGNMKEVKDVMSVPVAIQEGEEKESNGAMQEVETDVTSVPEYANKDGEGGRTSEEEEEKGNNGTMQEVETEDVTSVPVTIQEGEEKESNGAMQEVETDVTSVPEYANKDGEGGRTSEEEEEKGNNGTMQEVETEDVTSVPVTIQEGEEKESNGAMQELKSAPLAFQSVFMNSDEKLDAILSQLASNKAEFASALDERVGALREEFVQTSKDIKRLKAEKDYTWRREGNKIQFNFNEETADVLKQVLVAIQSKLFEDSETLIASELERILKRNKLIKIADSSEDGWETVRNYVTNDLADDSDDDRKISRADNKALRKLLQKRGRAVSYQSRSTRRPTPTSQPVHSTLHQAIPVFHQPSSSHGGKSGKPGACFTCGDFGHFRRECPFNPSLSAGASASTSQGNQ